MNGTENATQTTVDALRLVDAKETGFEAAKLEAEALTEYSKLKAESESRARRADVVSIVCIVIIVASVLSGSLEVAGTALVIFAASYAPHVVDKIKGFQTSETRS